ncbi:phosphopantetheine-binding protein [Salinarimonas sp.]|uniref:phosphopantetheine-binding protein n=1 Tax=Salinarimonas sp. TaxID=2766526 RepID=UPI0032D8F112
MAREDITRQFVSLLIERLNLELEPEDVADDTPLFGAGLGLDSIDALEIALAIETEFKCEVSDDQMQVLRSINTVVDFIQQSRASSISEAV